MFTFNKQIFFFFVALVVLTASIFGANYLLGINQFNNGYANLAAHECQLISTHCNVKIGDTDIKISVSAAPQIEEMTDLTISLVKPEQVEQVWVEGVNMYMGIIPVPKNAASPGQEASSEWQGWFSLGSCTEPNMQWRLAIKLKDQQQLALVYFDTSTN